MSGEVRIQNSLPNDPDRIGQEGISCAVLIEDRTTYYLTSPYPSA